MKELYTDQFQLQFWRIFLMRFCYFLLHLKYLEMQLWLSFDKQLIVVRSLLLYIVQTRQSMSIKVQRGRVPVQVQSPRQREDCSRIGGSILRQRMFVFWWGFLCRHNQGRECAIEGLNVEKELHQISCYCFICMGTPNTNPKIRERECSAGWVLSQSIDYW
jgi:hypothetical protein